MIRFDDVQMSFDGQVVLEGINLEVRRGERLCIVGKSGSGKSVTLKLMSGLLSPDSGTIWVDNQDATGYGEKQWNKVLARFGVVFQGAALFDSLSILENVALRLMEEGRMAMAEMREKAEIALDQVGLSANILDKNPAELSGGMQKRVSIARAIIHEPEIILYDEPTTGLDPETAGKIDRLILKLAAVPDRTTVVVTHDINTIKQVADRVILISNGKVAFEGLPDELFASEEKAVVDFLSREGTVS